MGERGDPAALKIGWSRVNRKTIGTLHAGSPLRLRGTRGRRGKGDEGRPPRALRPYRRLRLAPNMTSPSLRATACEAWFSQDVL